MAFRVVHPLTVWNVDAGGHSGAGEGEDVERGEVGQEELVLLELLGPRQPRENVLGRVYKGLMWTERELQYPF